MYKFQRVADGPNRGSYWHPSFRKHQEALSRFITRGPKDAMRQLELERESGNLFASPEDFGLRIPLNQELTYSSHRIETATVVLPQQIRLKSDAAGSGGTSYVSAGTAALGGTSKKASEPKTVNNSMFAGTSLLTSSRSVDCIL